MTDQRPPRDDLVRAIFPGVEMRSADDGSMPTMTGKYRSNPRLLRMCAAPSPVREVAIPSLQRGESAPSASITPGSTRVLCALIGKK